VLPKTKKKIVRRKKGTPRKLYFDENTQKSIEVFQVTEDVDEKNKIYSEQILPAFDKLVENLIFIYDFKSGHASFIDLKNDCVSFLYETLHKWDPKRGTKAFSYFNVVAKNWLIIRSKKRAKNLKKIVSMSDLSKLGKRDKYMIETFQVSPSPDTMVKRIEVKKSIKKVLLEIKSNLKNENEISCIDSIIWIFENVDDIDFLNKRAVFFYLREMTGLTPKQLAVSVSSIKKKYRELKNDEEFQIF
tara:strand:+ start:250 stop:984 length:735 start_codon:yes stop_codon:yes gene_type:complete